MAKNYYELHVAGCTRQLPILPVSDTLSIAGFVILGDTEIVTRASEELAARVPKDTDIIMTAETKGIPLAAELARVLGMKRYIVARKSVKAYMQNPIWVEDESITTKGKQRLYLMDTDVEMLHGKNVLLLDDVISTGRPLLKKQALMSLAKLPSLQKEMQQRETTSFSLKNSLFLNTNNSFNIREAVNLLPGCDIINDTNCIF